MKNKKAFLVILLICLFLVLVKSGQIQAQEITGSDLSKVQVDQLTDDQVKAIVQKAELSGMSGDEIETAAKAKGMPSTEIIKLKARMAELKTSSTSSSEELTGRTRENTIVVDSLKAANPLAKTMFGFSLFTNKALSFEPSTNIATPMNYQLGPGDKLIIDIWGASQETYTPKVSAEGNIIISNVGPIYISGMTIEEATIKIKKELSSIYAGLYAGNTFMKISLSAVRSIKVNIVGDVALPGTYTLSSLSTVLNALYIAGGPSENGTLRDVKVIRSNKTAAVIDFYEFLMKGILPDNMRLQDEDIIFVSTYTKRVDVTGEVKRPALFDLKPNETLKDLIYYAGNYTGSAYSKQIKITRKTGKDYKVYDVPYTEQDSFNLYNGDLVSVDKILNEYENRVEIKGAVWRPGIFAIDSNLMLKQLIAKAEGLKGDVFGNRISVYRLMPDLTTKLIPLDLSDSDKTLNFKLQREDIVTVSSTFDITEDYNFSIAGEIKSPGTYAYKTNTTVEDLIIQAGGLLESASCANIEVARRIKNDTSTKTINKIADIFKFSISKDLKLSDSASSFILGPFDQVFVRISPAYSSQKLVLIEGEVVFPGFYSISEKNERVSDLIKRAGNITPEAYVNGARLIRELTSIQKIQLGELKKLKSRVGDSTELTSVLADRESTLSVNLEKIMKHPGSDIDLVLQKGDVLKIPKNPQTVGLNGALLYPTIVRYKKGQKLRKYISDAGGFSDIARPSKVYVVHLNGSVYKTHKILFFNSYPRVEPGAEIIVPVKKERQRLSKTEAVGFGTAMASFAMIVIYIINALK